MAKKVPANILAGAVVKGMQDSLQQNIALHGVFIVKIVLLALIAMLFCLTFCENFWKFGLICIWLHIPDTLPFLTVENIRINIPNVENVVIQGRMLIIVMSSIDRTSNLQFISENALTKAHADSAERSMVD